MIIQIEKLKNVSYEDLKKSKQEYHLAKKLEKEQWYELFYKKYHIPSSKKIEEYNDEFEDTFVFTINKENLNTQYFEHLEELAKSVLKDGKQPIIIISQDMKKTSESSAVSYNYSYEDMRKITTLNNSLIEEHGMEKQILFNEFIAIENYEQVKEAWSLEDVYNANKNIDEIVNKIKAKEFSPFEAMLYIHRTVTYIFEFNKDKESFSSERSRVLPDMFKNETIVCSGFASLVKAIIDKLDMPDLKCDFVGCRLYNKHLLNVSGSGHCHNLITIKDEKYKLDGHYVEDATWDARNDIYQNGQGFGHCLYPVTDLKHIKNYKYFQKFEQTRYSTIIEGKKKNFFEKLIDKSSTPEIINKYGANSSPISKENFIKALTEIYEKYPPEEKEDLVDIEKYIESIMKISSENAQDTFDDESSSCFTQCKKTKTTNKEIER